jgi:hypothetical protein
VWLKPDPRRQEMTARALGLCLVVVAAVATPAVLTGPVAAGVAPSLIAQYLGRMNVEWKVDSKDPNVFRVTKTTGLKQAQRVEVIITDIPDNDLVTLRAFPQAAGKYLSLSAASNSTGLMREMLSKNATAFGAYFVDEDGDIGFRYVFTTEDGLGYDSFKVAVTELLRIADGVMVPLYNKYR